MGRLWHFFFAWLLVINGLIFAIYAFARRHVRDLAPNGHDLRSLPHEIVDHARLHFPKGEAARHYNALQKLAYFSVIFILGPLIVLTGLTMSPTMDSAFPFLPWMFGGRQSARTIHFICAFSFLGFFIVHMVMVVLSGTWNNVRSMITGRYLIEDDTAGRRACLTQAAAISCAPRLSSAGALTLTGCKIAVADAMGPGCPVLGGRTDAARPAICLPAAMHSPPNTPRPTLRRCFAPTARSIPPTKDYQRHVAEGFANWRVKVDGLVEHPLSLIDRRLAQAARRAPRSPATIASKAGPASGNGRARR